MILKRFNQYILENVEFTFKTVDLEKNVELMSYYTNVKKSFEESFENDFLAHILHQITTYLQAEGFEVKISEIRNNSIYMWIVATMNYGLYVDTSGFMRLIYIENEASCKDNKMEDLGSGYWGDIFVGGFAYAQCLSIEKVLKSIKLAEKVQMVPIKMSHPEKTINFPKPILDSKETFEKYMKTVHLGDFWYGVICIGGIKYKVSQGALEKLIYQKL